MEQLMAKRGDWLKAAPEKAREMGRRGGKAWRVDSRWRTPEYLAGYAAGFKAGRREAQKPSAA